MGCTYGSSRGGKTINIELPDGSGMVHHLYCSSFLVCGWAKAWADSLFRNGVKSWSQRNGYLRKRALLYSIEKVERKKLPKREFSKSLIPILNVPVSWNCNYVLYPPMIFAMALFTVPFNNSFCDSTDMSSSMIIWFGQKFLAWRYVQDVSVVLSRRTHIEALAYWVQEMKELFGRIRCFPLLVRFCNFTVIIYNTSLLWAFIQVTLRWCITRTVMENFLKINRTDISLETWQFLWTSL